MSPLTIILILASVMLAVGVLAILTWFVYTTYLNYVERRLARRKGLYRKLVAELAVRDRALLEPEIHRLGTLLDLEALEAVLEEQARATDERPEWLLDVYDRLGLVDKYIGKLHTAGPWRERAFAAELLGRVGNGRAVPALLETAQATRSEDADVREIALRALARIADPRAVEVLVQSLKTAEGWLAPRIADILTRHGSLAVDPMIEVLEQPGRHPARAWAANVLGEVRAARAFPALVRGLADLEDEVRAKSATALGRLGDRRAIAYLLEHLLTDPTPFVRARIAGALGHFDDPEVIDRLVRALGDPAWWVRIRSVEALEQIGRRAEGPLLVALDDPDPEIRIRAAVGLERLGVPATLAAGIQRGERVPEATEILLKFAAAGARELLAELLLHQSVEVRAAVVAAIRRAGRRDLAEELMDTSLRDADPALRAAAFEALGAMGVREALPAALGALGDGEGQVRAAAIGVLASLGDADVVTELRQRTGDPEPGVRAAAARALGLLRAADAAPDFLRLIGDPYPAVREAGAAGAADAEVAVVVPGLIDLLGDASPEVRRAAVEGLGRLGDRTSVPPLVHAFQDADPPMREAIVEAVSHIDAETVDALIDTLVETGDSPGKLGAIRTLARLQSPAAGWVLERLRKDPDPPVRVAAVEGFAQVGGDPARLAVEAGLEDPEEAVRAAALDVTCRLEIPGQGPRLLALVRDDPSPVVRERAALAVGLLGVEGGAEALDAVCRRPEPIEVRTAAALAVGAFEGASIVARVAEMRDEAAVRARLRERLEWDETFRLLASRLSPSRHVELRALGADTPEAARSSLVVGMRSTLDAADRIRLIAGLGALDGEQSRGALLQVVRGDPSPEVRKAALVALGALLDVEDLLAVGQRALGDPSLLVRRAAVGLFAEHAPERGLPSVLRTLRADDDPAVLAGVAALAEAAFPVFMETALGMSLEGPEALLVARVARHVHHPDLVRLLPVMARSGAPAVREAIAALWRHRPDIVDAASLDALAMDPVATVRQEAAGAAAGARAWSLLARMAQDPDADVRREAALVLGGASLPPTVALETLVRLAEDPDMAVRAAAYVGRLLQGTPLPLPPGLDPRAAAVVVRSAAHLPALRQTARTAPGEDPRLAAALALALLEDDVARDVARTDPVPSIRYRVTGALDLAADVRERE